jgi:general secretion pathway protein D
MTRPSATLLLLLILAGPLAGQAGPTLEARNDSVRIRLVNTELRAAIQAIGRYLAKPVLTGAVGDVRIDFFETPIPVARASLPGILKGLAEAHGFDFVEDSTFFKITPRAAAPAAQPARTVAQPQAQPKPEEPVPVRLFTVRLKHARASDVAATLNQLYGAGGAYSRSGGLSSGTLSDELRTNRDRPAQRDAARTGQGQDDASLHGTVTIVPDELTNSLLIRSTQIDFTVLREGIEQLDVRPLQVLVEVIVVEARKDRQFSLGFDAQLPSQEVSGASVEGSVLGTGLGDLVVKVMGLGRREINTTLTAARSRGDVEIVSRPVLLASNNTEARMLVGTQQPFVQVSRSLPTDTPQRDQVVQYRDVGTKLIVLPTINQDGYVSLTIQQEISAATGETQFSAPVISSREAVTQVLVADGQTIVIGGLRDRIHDRIRTGVPILADIPLVGGLFGGSKTRTTETELFLFITPTIIRDDAGAADATRARTPDLLKRSLAAGYPDTVPVPDTTLAKRPSGRIP